MPKKFRIRPRPNIRVALSIRGLVLTGLLLIGVDLWFEVGRHHSEMLETGAR